MGWRGEIYLYCCTFGSVDAAGFHGGNNGAVCGVGDGVAFEPGGSGTVVEGQILVFGEEGGVLEGGFDVELAVLDEDIFIACSCLFKFAVAVLLLSSSS